MPFLVSIGLLVDLLHPAGGALLHPFNVWIVGGRNRLNIQLAPWRRGETVLGSRQRLISA